jgi:hypothetical protein
MPRRRTGGRPSTAVRRRRNYSTYLWAFLAAVTTFVVGAGFALFRGVDILLHGERRDPTSAVPFVVLLLAFVLESASLRRGVSQARAGAERAGRTLRTYVRVSSDTTLKAVRRRSTPVATRSPRVPR